MSPFSPELVTLTDYLHTARDLRIVVAGTRGDWHPKVRGTDPDDEAEVTVASYDVSYPRKAEATARARELLRHVRYLRVQEAGRARD